MDNQLTASDHAIYNSWLKAYRQSNGQPFSPRRNFTTIDNETSVSIQKIRAFFEHHPAVDVELFFLAPFAAHSDRRQHYPIQFFTTYKAMTLYVAYLKKLRSLDPDHDTSLMWAAKSLSYIIRYCSKEKISAYTYCVSEGGMPQCMIDYKHGYISPYTLIALPRVVDTINAMPGDIRELTFGLDDIFAYAHKLDNSVKMKQLMRGGLVKMTNALK